MLNDIASGGIKLRKAVTNDRSAPIVGKTGPASSSSAAAGFAKPPTISAPPPVPGAVANRIRSNSASTSDAPTGSVMATAPQLGGLFAGGMPKLRKAKGSVDTGGV